ncbi:MAG: carboxypeptidase regulatory-like domain-containing protein [Candidatus Koribacter versatilis]|nr:carboxypeptidase regulatory-like domain-containing protein [Candidatus Koribacter versatilis]
MNTKWEQSRRLRGGSLLYFIYFLSLLCLLPSPAFSQRAARATVDGVVTEADGTPVAGAQVVLQTSDGKNPRGAKTDAKGRFAFRSLRHGFYDVRASRENRSSEWVRNLVVRSGTIVTVTLVLPEKSDQ